MMVRKLSKIDMKVNPRHYCICLANLIKIVLNEVTSVVVHEKNSICCVTHNRHD